MGSEDSSTAEAPDCDHDWSRWGAVYLGGHFRWRQCVNCTATEKKPGCGCSRCGPIEPPGSASSSPDEKCARCGCSRRLHFVKFGCNGCAIQMRGSDSIHAFAPAEPECSCSSGSPENYEGPARDCPVHGMSEQTTPPRRPPYAVAYATEGGAQYEIALPGDASVRAVDGALIITHDSAVLALSNVRPMEQ